MKQYDFAFSCGLQCGASMALREAGLQFASYPFDWVFSPSLPQSVRLVSDGCAHWLEPQDLELVDVRRGGIGKHVYRNRRTGVWFVHDFSSFRTFEENLPEVTAKYQRRIQRLRDDLSRARQALAVCIESPRRPRLTDGELAAALQILRAAYPAAKIELLYFFVREGVNEPVAESSCDGVTAVGLDYRTFDGGELNHLVETSGVVRYLRANVSVPDRRTDEQKRRYEADWRAQDRARWHGTGLVSTFVNRTAYRFYRKLEKFLVKKGLVPRERPLWCLPPEERDESKG